MLLDALPGDFIPVEPSYLSILTAAYMGQGTGKKDRRYEAEIQVFPQLCAGSFSYYLP